MTLASRATPSSICLGASAAYPRISPRRENTVLRVVMRTARSQGIDPDPYPPRLDLHRRGIGKVGRQLPEQVQAALFAADLGEAEITVQRREQGVATGAVLRPDAREMGSVAAAAHHLREHRLVEPWIAVVEQRLHGANGIGEMRRNHHVAEPQPGAERLRERPEIDGAVGSQRRDRRQRRALVAEVAVVVVLQEDSSRCGAPRRSGGCGARPRACGRSDIDGTG